MGLGSSAADIIFFKLPKIWKSKFRKSVPRFFAYWHTEHVWQVSWKWEKNCRWRSDLKKVWRHPDRYQSLIISSACCKLNTYSTHRSGEWSLTFDPWPPKVGRFMSLPRGLLLPIGIKIDSFVFTSLVTEETKNGRTNGRTDNLRTLYLRLPIWPGGGIMVNPLTAH